MSRIKLSNRSKALLPFLLLILLIAGFGLMGGCETDIDKVKLNREVVSEYNKSIERFNEFSHAFTKLGKTVDKAGEEQEVLNEEFWKKVEKQKTDVLEKMARLKEFQFHYKEFERVNDDISPMLDDAERYIDQVYELKNTNSTRIDADKQESLRTLYKAILNKSADVVNTYDILYMEFVTKSKRERGEKTDP